MDHKQDRLKTGEMESRQMVRTSLLLVLLALVSVTVATYAWFSIADRTRVRSMSMEITTGANLRFDLDEHSVFDDYVKTLSFEDIANRMRGDYGFDMREVPLEPVTTSDYQTFTFEKGKVAELSEGVYLEFWLHFMGLQDMYVHLTPEDSEPGKGDGTKISSENPNLPRAMRISFTVDHETVVYDTAGEQEPELFFLKAEENLPVLVHIWLEGTDEACTDDLKGADYSISLRFIGTDENGEILDGPETEE